MSYIVPDKTRYEIKYIARETNLASIIHWIRMNPEGFIKAYPDRWVNNIYFDTPDCIAFKDNLSGTSSRTKVRYRWYGLTGGYPDKGFLEIKRKRNMFVWKLLYRANEAPYFAGANWQEVYGLICRQMTQEGKQWLNDYPHPVLINHYYRRYYVSYDQRVRITVDNKQKIFDQRFKNKPNLELKANIPETLIVEIKFDRKERNRVTQIIQDIPIRYSRHSKYMTGQFSIQNI